MIRVLVLMLMVLPAAVAETPVYKWQDEQGRVHYGSSPPAAAPAESVKIKETPPPAPDAGLRPGERALLNEAKARDRAAAAQRQKAAEQEAEHNVQETRQAAAQQEKCARARQQLDDVEGRLRTGYAPSAGADLHSRQDKYRQQVGQYCD